MEPETTLDAKTLEYLEFPKIVARLRGLCASPGGQRLAEALTPPADAAGYHAAFDRGAPIEGQELWNLSPADGSIGVGDIGGVVAQFGHSCA